MRLIKFKVQNFRSVVDSGWIDAEQVTALIGVNESGKTNLLLPLWKLNPAREGEIRPTSDYPKGNYAAVREKPKEFWFVHAYFDVDELADKIATLTDLDRTLVNVAYVARNFAGQFWVAFPNYRPPTTASATDLTAQIDRASSEISAMSPFAKEVP